MPLRKASLPNDRSSDGQTAGSVRICINSAQRCRQILGLKAEKMTLLRQHGWQERKGERQRGSLRGGILAEPHFADLDVMLVVGVAGRVEDLNHVGALSKRNGQQIGQLELASV